MGDEGMIFVLNSQMTNFFDSKEFPLPGKEALGIR